MPLGVRKYELKDDFFRWNKLLKWCLFQARIFSIKNSRHRGKRDKEEEVDGISADDFQLSLTKVGKVGSVSHICSNRNGFRVFCSDGSVLSKMGAVVRFNTREMRNFSSRKQKFPFSVA